MAVQSLIRSRRVLQPSLGIEMFKVSTLQNGRLSSVAKRSEPILQAADGGGDEHIGVAYVRHQLFKIAVLAIARGVSDGYLRLGRRQNPPADGN